MVIVVIIVLKPKRTRNASLQSYYIFIVAKSLKHKATTYIKPECPIKPGILSILSPNQTNRLEKPGPTYNFDLDFEVFKSSPYND